MGSEADSIERDVRNPPVDVETTVMPHANALTGFCTALTTLLLDGERGQRLSPSQRT
jgi:hypothetical protein